MAYTLEILPSLLAGLKMTLGVFALTLIGSIPLGALVAVGMRSRIAILRWFINGYVALMRGTPLLLQIVFVYYGLSLANIMVLPRFEAAVLTFVLNYTAYFAEIFRGGIQAIPQGQLDGARVLGLTKAQTFRYVILPQVVKLVMPSVGNEVVSLVKDTSLVYVIGLGDLMRAGNIAVARDITLVPYLWVGAIYLALTLCLTWLMRQLEKRFERYQ